MVCRRAVAVMAVVVTVAAIPVAKDGDGKCSPFINMGETSHPWTHDCYRDRKWMGNQDLKQGVQNLMNKTKESAFDGKEYASKKADVVSNSTLSFTKHDLEDAYNEAKHKVEEAYDTLTKSHFSKEAKAKYVAAKERASDVAGEIGAKMRQ